MNQLLKTIDITRNRSSFENTIETVEAEIHIIAINSVCFTASENKATFEIITKQNKKSQLSRDCFHSRTRCFFDRIQTITQFASGYFLKLKYTTQ
jgi:hypothetical protein